MASTTRPDEHSYSASGQRHPSTAARSFGRPSVQSPRYWAVSWPPITHIVWKAAAREKRRLNSPTGKVVRYLIEVGDTGVGSVDKDRLDCAYAVGGADDVLKRTRIRSKAGVGRNIPVVPNPVATLDLDTFGTFWQGDVAQVMYDPILPHPTPLTNPVSINNYNPVGAGAKLEEAVSVQPVGSPAMPTNSRPLDTAGMIAAINAMALGSGFDAAPVNPEGWPLGVGVSRETDLITGSAPWNNLPT